MKFSRMELELLRDFEGFFKFIRTWDFNQSLMLPHTMCADFTGNQRGKTAQKARQYVMRILGWHPMPKRNVVYFECPDYQSHEWVTHDFGDGVKENIYKQGLYSPINFPLDGKCEFCRKDLRLHQRESKVMRFCSQTLPGETETVGVDGTGQSIEVGNVVYPAFKKWLPKRYIRKDITSRSKTVIISDPLAGMKFGSSEYRGEDIIVEFVSYHQKMQRQAGVQRLSVWEDEEPPYEFHEEQVPRVIAEDGDIVMTLTPAHAMSWTFDEIFEASKLYLKTDAILEFLRKKDGADVKKIMRTDSERDIAIIQAATDDNPTMSLEEIERHYFYDDPDTMATRRYGIHRQVSGRIFPGYDRRVHEINVEDYI